MIQRRARRTGQPRHGLDHNNILCIRNAQDTLPKDRLQLLRYIQLRPVAGHRILIHPLSNRLLDQMQLLNVPGNRCLRAVNPALLKPSQKLLLRLNVFLGNDIQNHRLTVILHPSSPPGSIFWAKISQKLRSDKRTSRVTYFDRRTCILSSARRANARLSSTNKYTGFRPFRSSSTVSVCSGERT